MNPWLWLGIASVVSALAVGLCRTAARRFSFLDRPGVEAHKQQTNAVPYGGGIGIAAAFSACVGAAWLLTAGEDRRQELQEHGIAALVAVFGGALLFVLGLWDDLRHLRALPKMIIQAAVCAAAVWLGDLGIDSLAGFPGLAFIVAWAWLLLVTNVYNLLDHADGLAASVALVSAGVLLYGSAASDDGMGAVLWASLIGSLAGFLVWNLPPARIYMGDSGSLPLGFLIGVGTLSVTFWPSGEGGTPLAILSPVLITAIPLFDTAVVVWKRMRRGASPFIGDRNHISHRLRRLGMGPLTSLATVVALQIALAAGTLQLRTQDWLTASVVLAQAAAVLLAVVLLETSRDGSP